MSESVVLQEDFDENYEPTFDEIEEYAKFIGMDLENDRDLLWIARQSLKAPLPPNWKPCQTDDGNIYYFNFETGESLWDHPCDDKYRALYKEEKEKLMEKSRLALVGQKESEINQLGLLALSNISNAPKGHLAPLKKIGSFEKNQIPLLGSILKPKTASLPLKSLDSFDEVDVDKSKNTLILPKFLNESAGVLEPIRGITDSKNNISSNNLKSTEIKKLSLDKNISFDKEMEITKSLSNIKPSGSIESLKSFELNNSESKIQKNIPKTITNSHEALRPIKNQSDILESFKAQEQLKLETLKSEIVAEFEQKIADFRNQKESEHHQKTAKLILEQEEKLNQTLTEIKTKHDNLISEKRKGFDTEISNLLIQQESEKSNALQKHQKNIDSIEKQFDQDLEKIRKEHEAQISEQFLNSKLQEKIEIQAKELDSELLENHKIKMAQIQALHQQKLLEAEQSLEKELEAKLEILKSENESKLCAKKIRIEQELKRNLDHEKELMKQEKDVELEEYSIKLEIENNAAKEALKQSLEKNLKANDVTTILEKSRQEASPNSKQENIPPTAIPKKNTNDLIREKEFNSFINSAWKNVGQFNSERDMNDLLGSYTKEEPSESYRNDNDFLNQLRARVREEELYLNSAKVSFGGSAESHNETKINRHWEKSPEIRNVLKSYSPDREFRKSVAQYTRYDIVSNAENDISAARKFLRDHAEKTLQKKLSLRINSDAIEKRLSGISEQERFKVYCSENQKFLERVKKAASRV